METLYKLLFKLLFLFIPLSSSIHSSLCLDYQDQYNEFLSNQPDLIYFH